MKLKKPKITKKKILSFFSSLAIFGLIAILFMRFTTPTVQAVWFDDTYAYRLKITFTHNAVITSDRSVTYSLNTAEIISANLMQSDCDDIRFTDVNGKQLLYDLTGTCNNAATTFEIIFPTINNGTNIAYVYYGNPSAQNGEISSTGYTALTPSGGDPADTTPTSTDEQGPSPISYWDFEEGAGTTANDYFSQQNNDLTITGAVWKNSDLCLFSRCLYYDGNADRATKSYSSDTELLPSTASFTISTWAKHSVTLGADTLISRADGVNGVGWKLYMDGSGFICFGIDASAGSFPSDSACTTTSYADGNWHYIVGVKSTTSSITLYIDGAQISQDASITNSSLDGTNAPFTVGNDFDNGTNGWDGFIDEVKYYNFAKTTTQVATEYTSKSQAKAANATFGASSANNSLANGLLGYWKMDETTANTCTGGSNDSCDSSGNANDGAWNGNATSISTGKYYYGTVFDGTGDYVSTNNNNSVKGQSQITVSLWMYPTTVNSTARDVYVEPINVDDSNRLELYLDSDNAMYFGGRSTDSNSFEDWADGTTTISANNWYHVVAIYDGLSGKHSMYVNGVLQSSFSTTPRAFDNTTPNSPPKIGCGTTCTTGFIGRIDELKVYKRALSVAEVNTLYDTGPAPVGYYKLDEGVGTTVSDVSSGNTGVLTTGPVWVTGRFGQALKFDGTASYMRGDTPSTNLAIIGDVTVSAWVNRRIASADHTVVEYASNGETETTNEAYSLLIDSANKLQLNWEHSTGTNDSVVSSVALTNTSGVWEHVAAVRDVTANTVTFYENGVQLGTVVSYTNDPTGSDSSSNRIDIGRDASNGTNFFDGAIDDTRIYNYALNAKQLIAEMNADHPAIGTPVGSYAGYWTMDENRGSTANDKSINANNLTLSSSSWSTSGKFYAAWNGTGALWLSRADDDDFDFASTDDLSISLWFKSDSASNPGATEYLLDKSLSGGTQSAGYAIYAKTTGLVCFGIDDDTTWGPDDEVCSQSDIYDATWHHIVARKTATARLDLFVDGKLDKSLTTLTATATLANARILYVGDRDGTDNGDELNGDIDELKIYRSALSLPEVQVEYNQSNQTNLSSLSTTSGGTTASFEMARSYCVPGDTSTCNVPVIELQMDENSGTSAFDTSGNGNTGTLTSGPTWSTGKVGPAVSFDGSDDYITVTDANSLDLTTAGSAMAWVKRGTTGTYDAIFAKGSVNAAASHNYAMEFTNTDTMDVIVGGGGASSQTCNDGATTFTDTTNWHHYAMTWDNSNIRFYYDGKQAFSCTETVSGTANAAALLVGMFGGNVDNLAGQIDQVRVYNYARTSAQIAWDYNRDGATYWYKFDDCQGATTYDSSGNGNTGTLTVGASGTQTAIGDCTTASTAWGNGATGKYSSSLNFDGTDDYVSLATNPNLAALSTYSVTAWFKTSNTSTVNMIYGEGSTSTGNPLIWISTTGAAGKIQFEHRNDAATNDSVLTSTEAVADGTWHHLAAVREGTASWKLYIDGRQSTTGSTSVSTTTTNNGRIGVIERTSKSQYFPGQIDDVRLFKFNLTATQVKTIYNEGFATRFGPATGSP